MALDSQKLFLPSLPARGATMPSTTIDAVFEISTLAPREGSDGAADYIAGGQHGISTLAPREGSDRPSNFVR